MKTVSKGCVQNYIKVWTGIRRQHGGAEDQFGEAIQQRKLIKLHITQLADMLMFQIYLQFICTNFK